MTLATYVEMPTPRREMDSRMEDLLPAELTVAFGAADAAVAESVPLHEFLKNAGTLTHAERLVIVEQALLMLEGNYVHLPLKSAMHAVNPVQRLRLLRARLQRQTDADDGPRADLPHGDVGHLPLGARPAHQLPAARAVRRADRLPAVPGGEVRRRRPDDVHRQPHRRRAVAHPRFQVGVEITHWNGMPIDRAVAVAADRFAGSNMPARLARGVDSLTIRPLRLHLPPDEEWVTVSYVDADGVRRELREPWLVAPNATGDGRRRARSPRPRRPWGWTWTPTRPSRARALLFAPQVVEQTRGRRAAELSHRAGRRRAARCRRRCRWCSGRAAS